MYKYFKQINSIATLIYMHFVSWQELPQKIDESSDILRVPQQSIRIIIEIVASLIFGVLIESVGIDYRKIFTTDVPIPLIFALNYLLFKILQLISLRFHFPEIPILDRKRSVETESESFIKTITLPTAGIILFFTYGVVALVMLQMWKTGIKFNFLRYIYAYFLNGLFILFLDQFARISDKGKLKIFFFISAIILFSALTYLTILNYSLPFENGYL